MSENNFSATITTDGRPLDLGQSFNQETLKYPAPKGYVLNAVNLPPESEIVITVDGKTTHKMKQAPGSSRLPIDQCLPTETQCDPGVLVEVTVKVDGRAKATTKYRFAVEPEEWKTQRRQPTDRDNTDMLNAVMTEFTQLAANLNSQRSVVIVSEFRSIYEVIQRIASITFADFHISVRRSTDYLFERDAWDLLHEIRCAYWFCRAVVESAKHVPDGMTPITRNAVEKGLSQLRNEEKVAEQISTFPLMPRNSAALAKLVESGVVVLKPSERLNRGESEAEWTFVANAALLDKLPPLTR